MPKTASWKMIGKLAYLVSGVLVLLGACNFFLSPDRSAALKAGFIPKNTTPIQHIVFMVKENRSFDNYFGTFPGANGATTYIDPNGVIHPLNHEVDSIDRDIAHNHTAALLAYDNGKMDKFSQVHGAIQEINGVLTDVADSQFYQSDIPNYWRYAQTYTLADNFFSTISGPSFANHLFTIAGTDEDVDDNPKDPAHKDMQHRIGMWGCDSVQGTTVEERHADGSISSVFPCFDFTTLGDVLSAANISWKYYAPDYKTPGYQWSTYDAIGHIRETTLWTQHVVNTSNFISDVQKNSLPAVSWLVESPAVSDHAPSSVCAGEDWTVEQMNAIMQRSALWANTVIVLAWDEYGGFYDHIVPPVGQNTLIEYGFRIPAIIISPYAKTKTVDHTFYSFPSMLKMVEDIYHLPSLGGLDEDANSLVDALNFTQPPIPPLVLRTKPCPIGPSPDKLVNLED